LGANLGHSSGVFWQKRYYDRNLRDERQFVEKLRYIHRNPGGLCERPEDWAWSSFRHYALREKGVVEIESEWTARDRESPQRGEGSPDPRLVPKIAARTRATIQRHKLEWVDYLRRDNASALIDGPAPPQRLALTQNLQ
jgi:hypothetical protein